MSKQKKELQKVEEMYESGNLAADRIPNKTFINAFKSKTQQKSMFWQHFSMFFKYTRAPFLGKMPYE